MSMAESRNLQAFHDSRFPYDDDSMMAVRKERNDEESLPSSSLTTSSIGEESTVSCGSSSGVADDDASSSTASSPISSNPGRALYDLSEIMEQLPIKRGLSKFYNGKSESFTSLSRVVSVEDLPKKTLPCRRNSMASKSIASGLHTYKSFTLLPKPIITKKTSSFSRKRASFMQ